MSSGYFKLTPARKKIITEEIGKCENCGDKKSLEVHHIKKISKGGKNTPSNLIVLCHECHKDKAHRGSLSATTQRKIVANRSKRKKEAIKVILNKAKTSQKPKKSEPKPKLQPRKIKRQSRSTFDNYVKLPKIKLPKVDLNPQPYYKRRRKKR